MATFRAKAKELRARTQTIRDPAIRDGFLEVAAAYDRLTAHAEKWSVATNVLMMSLAPKLE
jgi:hypothetical protein